MAKKKYYVVWRGHRTGIYTTWSEAELQIKGYPGARFQGFSSLTAAEKAFVAGPESVASPKTKAKSKLPTSTAKPIPNSISVDAACSGNPGPMEYQGVITNNGKRIFHQAFPIGTNNIGEFLAIVHALALLQKQEKSNTAIYTDSKIAQGWVRKKKAKTTLVKKASTQKLYEMIERAEQWLKTNTYENPIIKWPTEEWGEIPAEDGRK